MRNLLLCTLLLLCSGVYAQQARINHVTVFVTDLQRGATFYHDVMGFDTIPEPFKDGKHTWFRIGDHQELHVVSGAKADIAHGVEVHMAFTVPDLAVFCKHLDQVGVAYGGFNEKDKKPTTRPDGINQVYFQDPDGYWIEVNNDRF